MRIKYLILPFLCLAMACKQKNNNLLHTSNADTSKENNAVAGTLKPVKAAQLIIPGKSIGNIHLNADIDSTETILGRADYTDAAMGTSFNTWYANHDTSDYQTVINAQHNYDGKNDPAQYIRVIRVTSPYFKTRENLHTGSTLQDISRYFKVRHVATFHKGTDSLRTYDDAQSGIAFEINNLKQCKGVIVHAPKDTITSYINMYPGDQWKRVEIKN